MRTRCPPGGATSAELVAPPALESRATPSKQAPKRRLPDTAKVRELAVRADVDPRTIVAVLKGRSPRGMAGRRAREVLIEAGLL